MPSLALEIYISVLILLILCTLVWEMMLMINVWTGKKKKRTDIILMALCKVSCAEFDGNVAESALYT